MAAYQRPQRKGEKLQNLILRQQRRLEQNRLVAEARYLEEENRIIEQNKLIAHARYLEEEKQAVITRGVKQQLHLKNWRNTFGCRSATTTATTTTTTTTTPTPSSTPSTALSPSTPFQPFHHHTTTNIIVRRRGARRNTTFAIPYSKQVIRAAQIEVRRQRQATRDQQVRKCSQFSVWPLFTVNPTLLTHYSFLYRPYCSNGKTLCWRDLLSVPTGFKASQF